MSRAAHLSTTTHGTTRSRASCSRAKMFGGRGLEGCRGRTINCGVSLHEFWPGAGASLRPLRCASRWRVGCTRRRMRAAHQTLRRLFTRRLEAGASRMGVLTRQRDSGVSPSALIPPPEVPGLSGSPISSSAMALGERGLCRRRLFNEI